MIEPSAQIPGVLLAGGRSQRMGVEDKCLARLAGRPLLSHAIERLRPQVSDLVLNANGSPGRFAQFALPVIADPIQGFAGPLAGILAGMIWARECVPGVAFVATVATDTPFFPRDLVRRLSVAIDSSHELAIACCHGRDYPVFGLFPIALAEDLELFLSQSAKRAVMAWLDRRQVARVTFDDESGGPVDPFFNINTPTDLDSAQAALEGT